MEMVGFKLQILHCGVRYSTTELELTRSNYYYKCVKIINKHIKRELRSSLKIFPL